MNNSRLKRLIKNAYYVEPSARKDELLKKYRQRRLNYLQMLYIQFQYMGAQLTLICGFSLAALLMAMTEVNEDLARLIAVFMPSAALIALTGLGKSTRYGMDEIEMSTRFSLRMIRILRLAIIGVAALVIMLSVSFALKISCGADMMTALALAGVPYLVTTFLCMLLLRSHHSPKNIYGCIVITACVSVAMFCGAEFLDRCSAVLRSSVLSSLFAVSIILTFVEAVRYINESEELQWNLC